MKAVKERGQLVRVFPAFSIDHRADKLSMSVKLSGAQVFGFSTAWKLTSHFGSVREKNSSNYFRCGGGVFLEIF